MYVKNSLIWPTRLTNRRNVHQWAQGEKRLFFGISAVNVTSFSVIAALYLNWRTLLILLRSDTIAYVFCIFWLPLPGGTLSLSEWVWGWVAPQVNMRRKESVQVWYPLYPEPVHNLGGEGGDKTQWFRWQITKL